MMAVFAWWPRRLRLLPLTIFGASLLLTVKLGALFTPGVLPKDAISVTPTHAQQAQPGPAGQAQPVKAAPTPLTPPAKPDAAKADAAKSDAPKADAAKTDATKADAAKPGASSQPAAQAQAAPPASAPGAAPAAPPAAPAAPAVAKPGGSIDPVTMSQSEIDILQALGERRRQLDERERAIEQREALLKAAEHRITEKVNELKAVQAKLEVSLKKQESEREEQLRKLVKVYENMKPKDAARIFEQLDDAVLIDVAERMKEVKLAPVLASMEAKKATSVTTELAKRREAPRPKGG